MNQSADHNRPDEYREALEDEWAKLVNRILAHELRKQIRPLIEALKSKKK